MPLSKWWVTLKNLKKKVLLISKISLKLVLFYSLCQGRTNPPEPSCNLSRVLSTLSREKEPSLTYLYSL